MNSLLSKGLGTFMLKFIFNVYCDFLFLIFNYFFKGERCIADYFQQYLNALGNNGEFYKRPLAGKPIRYGAQVVGVNNIKSFMKIICKKSGLVGNFTNHSGKRTCASQLYALRWMSRLLWRKRVIGQSGWSESSSDPAEKYLKM